MCWFPEMWWSDLGLGVVRERCRADIGHDVLVAGFSFLCGERIAAGNVVFSEVLTLPNGMSKGCG